MNKPKHPKVRNFLEQRLYHGLSSFHALESRISSLPTKKERGDAFEVFAEAYLATQPIVQAENVWPFNSIPPSIKQRFRLDTAIDMGVDGIFQTQLDEYNAYQAKFRSGRPALSWGELSTFMGLTDQIKQRVLFTNCDELPPVMNERTGFYCIRGADLDRLEPRDFEVILSWVEGASIRERKKEPMAHQQQALEKILTAFEREDRVTTIMACGTGKTLMAMWAAERMGCHRVLLLVPSLALLRQTLHEWLKEAHWEKVAYLCVCSDPTVKREIDDLIVRQSDLDFPVSTDSEIVTAFLEAEFNGVKLVFSTYQSAHAVAEGMDKTIPFELGIFDEAHRTAGREGAKFSFALNNENLPIEKRLFMTATPRHYDVQKKDKEGDAKIVYSMDVPENYGPVVHKLWFSEAARRDIICNYKVIISIITTDMVNDELLRRGEVIVDGDLVIARQVANQIALQKAVEKYDVRKIFTFHQTVALAKSFTHPGSKGIVRHLSDFESYHVNGAMPTANRDRLMREFRNTEKSVMSNARCLTEGVDVPAVDMVAFLSPKKSRIDIVHATGRAMRKKAGKTTGYILVPLFVEQTAGETIEEAVERGKFEEVWNVLQAMQEQDDILAEKIQQMRENLGQKGEYDDAELDEVVEILGPQLSLDTLRKSIAAACIDKLGSSWDEYYGQLKAFKEQHGHCNVSTSLSSTYYLGLWVAHQRSIKRKGKLREDRVRRLEEIGFVWDPMDAAWEEMYLALVEFKKANGHCAVPKRYTENRKLGNWIISQRALRKQAKLSKERISRLDEIGFRWDVHSARWEKMYAALVEFKKSHGHHDVSAVLPKNDKLVKWVNGEVYLLKSGRLSGEEMRRLWEIGVGDTSWYEMFLKLIRHKEIYGHFNVPEEWSESPELHLWLSRQRQAKENYQLGGGYVQNLEKIGFVWDTLWEKRFSELLEFKINHGHFNVPNDLGKYQKLRSWIRREDWDREIGELTEKRAKRLEEIGFVSDEAIIPTWWDEMLRKLAEYKKTHGDINLKNMWFENPKLARWVVRQRIRREGGLLSRERIGLLDALGFVWGPKKMPLKGKEDNYWEEMFSAIAVFAKRWGHTNVPKDLVGNPNLSKWVDEQRALGKKGKLTKERLRRLEEIGFIWDNIEYKPTKTHWEMMYSKLVEFQRKFRHCNVPQNWPRDPELAAWVNEQRKLKENGELSGESARQLDVLGFAWTKWDEMYSNLMEFKATHGHCNVPDDYTRLAPWVLEQRLLREGSQLSRDRITRLEALGFRWDIDERDEKQDELKWQLMYSSLSAFQKAHGHCNVPKSHGILSTWVRQQRKRASEGQLSSRQLKQLIKLGMVFV
jgi:superfamily II DNA or RNA helicase